MASLSDIYRSLYQVYGPQGWWPIVNPKTLVCEYGTGAPSSLAESFEIAVGCLLTQNTQWDPNVVRAITALKKSKMLSPSRLSSADTSVIAPLIRSAGYFNQKAERLSLLAAFWIEDASLFDLPLPLLRGRLLSQKGIGPETADSIILYAARKPSFVVDAYTRRIMARVGLCAKDASYDELQTFFHGALAHDAALFAEYHALLVEHAKRHCKSTPQCGGCPLAGRCKKRGVGKAAAAKGGTRKTEGQVHRYI